MSNVPDNMVLVLACSKKKVEDPSCKAGDLYLGSIYTKGKDIADRLGLPIWILSAKYGFLHPDTVVDNYDQKFKKAFTGPFPPAPWHGFYLGGQLYFKNMPKVFKPLVPPNQMGYMLRDLTALQNDLDVVRKMIDEHPGG